MDSVQGEFACMLINWLVLKGLTESFAGGGGVWRVLWILVSIKQWLIF